MLLSEASEVAQSVNFSTQAILAVVTQLASRQVHLPLLLSRRTNLLLKNHLIFKDLEKKSACILYFAKVVSD